MGNMIDIDSTIVIQLINFLVAIVVLNLLLIKPVRQQIASRNSLTEGLTTDIEQFTVQASEKISGYEAALAEARSKASLSRDALKAEGNAKEQELLKAAQNEAQAFLQSARAETAKEAKAATDALLSQVNSFAQAAMKKILG